MICLRLLKTRLSANDIRLTSLHIFLWPSLRHQVCGNLLRMLTLQSAGRRWTRVALGGFSRGCSRVFCLSNRFLGDDVGKVEVSRLGNQTIKTGRVEGLAAQRTEESSCFSTDRASNKQTWPCLDVVRWLKPTAGGWSNSSRTFWPVCPLNPWPFTVHWHTFLTTSRGNSAEPPVDTNSTDAATLFAF